MILRTRWYTRKCKTLHFWFREFREYFHIELLLLLLWLMMIIIMALCTTLFLINYITISHRPSTSLTRCFTLVASAGNIISQLGTYRQGIKQNRYDVCCLLCVRLWFRVFLVYNIARLHVTLLYIFYVTCNTAHKIHSQFESSLSSRVFCRLNPKQLIIIIRKKTKKWQKSNNILLL